MDTTSSAGGIAYAVSGKLELELSASSKPFHHPDIAPYALASPDGSHLALLSYAILERVWSLREPSNFVQAGFTTTVDISGLRRPTVVE